MSMFIIVLLGKLIGGAIGIGIAALIVISVVQHSNEWGDPDGMGLPPGISFEMIRELDNVDKSLVLRDFIKDEEQQSQQSK